MISSRIPAEGGASLRAAWQVPRPGRINGLGVARRNARSSEHLPPFQELARSTDLLGEERPQRGWTRVRPWGGTGPGWATTRGGMTPGRRLLVGMNRRFAMGVVKTLALGVLVLGGLGQAAQAARVSGKWTS